MTRTSCRAAVRALLAAAVVAAAFVWAVPAFAAGDILDSQPSNTQIRQAVDQSVTSSPSFTGQTWQTPQAGYNGAYSILPGASWLAETTNGGAPINHRWDQYRAIFDLPDGVTSAGVRLLVDNEATAMTLNGVAFGCGVDVNCNYYNGTRFAIEIPQSALQPAGNELLITVHNDETYATGGLTFSVVPAGIVLSRAAADVSSMVGSPLTVTGAFQQNFQEDVSAHPIRLSADNTTGTFTDNGDGTWSWTYTPDAAGSGTIDVTASDDRGLTASDSFAWTAAAAPAISLNGSSCLTVTNGLVQPYSVTVSGLNGYQGVYVFTELTSSPTVNFSQMYRYGYASLNGGGTVAVSNAYNYLPSPPASLWVDLRPANAYGTTVWARLQVPVCGYDTTPPVITHTVTGDQGTGGWYTSDVHVSFSMTDAQSTISSQTGCDDVDVTTDTAGETFTCTATSAGGTSHDSVTIQRDATPPAISAAATTDPNANGWYAGDVTVHFTCSDGLSGIADGACPADQVLTGEGAAVSSTAATVVDAAGNTSDASNVVTVQVDRTAPTVAFAPDGQTYDVSDTVSIACTASDALSGVDTSTCADVNAPAWTLGLGAHDLSASATDRAGNTGGGSGSYTVKATFGGVCALVQAWSTKDGVATSLCAKLAAASAARARGQDKAADNQLAAFRNELSAQSGKAFTADQASTLAAFSKTL